jgi:hypothetical protein
MKKIYESDVDTSATFYISLPPERINHLKSSGRRVISVTITLVLSLCSLLLLLYNAPGADDIVIMYVPSVQEVLSFIATCFAEWIPRIVSSLMLLYVGLCLGYAGVRLYLELPNTSVRITA